MIGIMAERGPFPWRLVVLGGGAVAMLPYLLTIVTHGVEGALEKCPELARGVYTLRGRRP